jgi:hypothetical protein
MERQENKVSQTSLIIAQLDDIEALKKVRKKCIKETYKNTLTPEQVDCLASQDPNPINLEKHINKGTVYLLKDESKDSLEGYAHMKFTPRSGENGVCTIEAIYPSKKALDEGIFERNLEAIETKVKESGCYKMKGVATEPELQILKKYGYTESAPSYRHTRDGVTINYYPFSKTLYFPEM